MEKGIHRERETKGRGGGEGEGETVRWAEEMKGRMGRGWEANGKDSSRSRESQISNHPKLDLILQTGKAHQENGELVDAICCYRAALTMDTGVSGNAPADAQVSEAPPQGRNSHTLNWVSEARSAP